MAEPVRGRTLSAATARRQSRSGGSYRVATLFGIPVRVHFTFVLFLALLAMVWMFRGGPAAAIRGMAFILALFVSVTVHEFAHSLVARRYGVKVREIILLPIGGISRLERMPDEPRQELAVALAGPLASIAVAVVLGVPALLLYGPAQVFSWSLAEGPLLAALARLNLLLAAFNLLPGFPMDGGRIFRALLAERIRPARATRIAARVGRGFAIILGIIGLFFNIWLLFIAVFIYFGARQEEKGAVLRAVLTDIPVSTVMVRRFRQLEPGDTVARAVEHAYHGFQEDFPVVENGRVVGILTRDNILSALHARGPETMVAEVMTREFVTATGGEPLDRVLTELQSCGCSSLPVVEGGELVGMVSAGALGRFVAFSTASREQ